MGFLSKLKENFTHGGVKVKLEAPASISMQDANLPVKVSITAEKSPQVVNSVNVQVLAETRSQAFGQSGSSTGNNYEQKVVARSENNEQFSISPGETKTVELSMVMNVGANAAENLPEGSAAAGAMHVVEKLQTLSQTLSQTEYKYYVMASADVEGIMLDPSDKQPIQILKPGQIGGAINLGT